MINEAFSDMVRAFSRYQDAIAALETELASSKAVISDLESRLEKLEEYGVTNTDMVERIDQLLETNTFDDLLERKVDDAISNYDFSDAIDTAMSGREVTITL
jgi:hypothetical protein